MKRHPVVLFDIHKHNALLRPSCVWLNFLQRTKELRRCLMQDAIADVISPGRMLPC